MRRSKIAGRTALITGLLLLQCSFGCFVDGSGDYSPADVSLIKSVAFVGSDSAWLTTAAGELKITTNGGKDWTTVTGPSVGGRFESIFFFSTKRGLAINQQGQTWKTDNGGNTWNAGPTLKVSAEAGPFLSASQLKFIDDSHGWVVETFRIWRTDNGGDSWREIYSVMNPKTDGQPKSTLLVNNEIQWLTTSKGQLLYTKDGAQSWEAVPFERNVSITDVAFVGSRGWAVGFRGLPPYTNLYRSDNTGETWAPLPALEPHSLITCMTFVSETEGWAAGRTWTGEPTTSGGLVLHTVNGGESWNKVSVNNGEQFFDRVHFLDSEHGWLFSRDNVYRTNDAGRTWQIVLKLL